MTENHLKEIIGFEETLKPGDECRALWTNSGYSYQGPVRVVRVNEKSVRVALLARVPGARSENDGYPQGQELVVPRFWDMRRWSAHNRLAPAGE